MLKQTKGDLRRRITNIDSKRHREDKPMLTGQETLRMFFDSLQGSPHEKSLHDLKKFMNIRMMNQDLRGFDEEWDNRLDKLAATECQMLTESEPMLLLRYLEQVRDHPLMKLQMAQWIILPQKEQTYLWLRNTVKRVLEEADIRENDKSWRGHLREK